MGNVSNQDILKQFGYAINTYYIMALKFGSEANNKEVNLLVFLKNPHLIMFSGDVQKWMTPSFKIFNGFQYNITVLTSKFHRKILMHAIYS